MRASYEVGDSWNAIRTLPARQDRLVVHETRARRHQTGQRRTYACRQNVKRMPHDAWREARLAIAGPLLGSAGALVLYLLAVAYDLRELKALASLGFLINLFNLLPRSRSTAAGSRQARYVRSSGCSWRPSTSGSPLRSCSA
jgi:hypothetical protein